MRNRELRVQFRLNNIEYECFRCLVDRSGLSIESYMRKLITGIIPKDKPPPDFYMMMRELHKIGVNLNQIAYKANALDLIDSRRYEEEVKLLESAIKKITNEIIKG